MAKTWLLNQEILGHMGQVRSPVMGMKVGKEPALIPATAQSIEPKDVKPSISKNDMRRRIFFLHRTF